MLSICLKLLSFSLPFFSIPSSLGAWLGPTTRNHVWRTLPDHTGEDWQGAKGKRQRHGNAASHIYRWWRWFVGTLINFPHVTHLVSTWARDWTWVNKAPKHCFHSTTLLLRGRKIPLNANLGQKWWPDFVWMDRILYDSLNGSGSVTLEGRTR